VFVTPDADRTMNTFLGVSGQLDSTDIDIEAIKHSNAVYIEGYLASADNARDSAIEVRRIAERRKIMTCLTLSDPNMVKFFRGSIEAMIGDGVDLLFANEDEAMELAASDNLADAVSLFKKLAGKFAITRGSQGALLFDGISEIEIKPRPVEAIDTLGAGDMFAGAMLYGLSQGMNFQRAGDLASLASAKIVTQFGPRLRAEQTQELLSSFHRDNA
jgi:sugar/nucleoside kinase (ribokinase family)